MKMPPVRILTQDLQLLGQLMCKSLLYRRFWQGVGEFQLVVHGNAPNAEKLKVGNLITLGGDGHRSGIITKITATENEKGVTYLVEGHSLAWFAAGRITLPDNDAYNFGYDNVPKLTSSVSSPSPVPAETILKTYAERHLVNPLDPKRKIPGLVIADDLGRGMNTVWSSRLEQLDTVLQAVSEYTDMGWEIYADLDNQNLVFDVIEGVDRSQSQSENSFISFSSGLRNISNMHYNYDISPMRNIGYAGGAGEGQNRIVLKVYKNTETEGNDRREIFLDCGNLEIVETSTTMSLADEGKHKLENYPLSESFTATIAPNFADKYQKNWDIGDKVTVYSKALGKEFDTRITVVEEAYEATKYELKVTFGTPKPELGRVIKSLKGAVR